MPRGVSHSDGEVDQIEVCRGEELGYKTVAGRIHRSRNVVWNYLRNPDACGGAVSPGRSEKLSPRDKRNILRIAANSENSLAQIRSVCELQIRKFSTGL